MIITVSDVHGVKQYDVSDNIKKIVILFLVVITIIIAGLAYSVKTLNDKLVILEKNINTERIVEKQKKHTSLIENQNFIPHINKINQRKEEEVKIDKILQVKNAKLQKEKLRKEVLAIAEKEKKEKLAQLEKEKSTLAKLAKEKKKKAKKIAKIKLDTEALIKGEERKRAKLAKIKKEKAVKLAKAKAKSEKKLKLAKLEKAKKKKIALAKIEKKKKKAKLAKLEKEKKAKIIKAAKAKQKKKALAQVAKKKKHQNVKIAKNNNYATYNAFKKNVNLRKSFKVYKNNSLLAKSNGRNTKLTVDISEQRVKLYVNGKIALCSPCTTGAKRKFEPNTKIYRDKRTPKGTFKITEKIADKRSTIFGKFYRNGKMVYKGDRRKYRGPKAKYKGASLKNWMRLTSGGIGLHASKYVKRYPGTNGCIRLPYKVSKTIFKNVRKGTKVTIIN